MTMTIVMKRSVVKWALLSRIFVFLLALCSRGFLGSENGSLNDSSGEVAAMESCDGDSMNNRGITLDRLFGHFANWDGVYFARIAQCGYEFEQFHAFFPLYPVLVQYVARIFSPIVGGINRPIIVACGFLVSNLSFVAAAVTLYHLTKLVLRDDRLAETSAILFCVNPASVFMSAMYTESLFSFCCFAGLLCLERASDIWDSGGGVALRLVAGTVLCFAAASATRSNGIILSFYIAYQSVLRADFSSIFRCVAWILATLMCMLCATAPLAVFETYGKSVYCSTSSQRPWCESGTTMYAFVQQEYWNVGFFKYYEWKQIPNFALASPILVGSFACLFACYVNFASMAPRFSSQKSICAAMQSLRRMLKVKAKVWRRGNSFPPPRVFVYAVHWTVLLLVGLCFIHIQVLTRFLCCQCPLLYWCTARFAHSSKSRRIAVAFGFSLYIIVGTLFFANFYPWT